MLKLACTTVILPCLSQVQVQVVGSRMNTVQWLADSPFSRAPLADIVTKFCLAYKDETRGMVTDHKFIAQNYLRYERGCWCAVVAVV